MIGADPSKVWSFSPPEEMFIDRPPTLGQRPLEASERPMSALPLDYRRMPAMIPGMLRRNSLSQDVDMPDAGPSTAPLQQGNTTFFHDD